MQQPVVRLPSHGEKRRTLIVDVVIPSLIVVFVDAISLTHGIALGCSLQAFSGLDLFTDFRPTEDQFSWPALSSSGNPD